MGRLSKNTRRPFEKPPRHNLLSLSLSPSSPIESPIHDCARNLDQGPSCRCLPTRNSDIATQRFALTLLARPSLLLPTTIVGHTCVAHTCDVQARCMCPLRRAPAAKARAGTPASTRFDGRPILRGRRGERKGGCVAFA